MVSDTGQLCPFSVYKYECDKRSCEGCPIREELERKENEKDGEKIRAYWNEYPDRA